MRKTGYSAFLGTLLGSAILLAAPAAAQNVIISGAPVVLHVYTAANGIETGEELIPTEVEAEQFSVLGRAGNDMVLIRIGGDSQDLYVSREELSSLLPTLELDRFPSTEDVAAISQGANGDGVVALQEVLKSLGYLEGEADGAYGGGTAEAVRRFQEAHNLEPTGTADIYTMLLITAIQIGLEEGVEVSSKEYTSPEEKFPEIVGRTEADLSPFLNAKWRFRYDPIEETGTIEPSVDLGFFSVEAPPIDEISGTLAVKVVIVKDSDTNSIMTIPAVTVETEGAYRPYVQGAVLVGDETVRTEGGKSTGMIDGITLKESGYVPLTKEVMELLKGGSVHTIRLLGKNTSYDVEAEYNAEEMTAFMEACETLVE